MEGKEEKKQMAEGFQVTLSLDLTTYLLQLKLPLGSACFDDSGSLNWARELRRRRTRRSTKIRTSYDRSICFL